MIVGRITHDAETASMSKLAEGAMVIESSRATSGGARTPLRLDPTIKIRGAVKDVGGFGLYPGQMAAFKGRNGGGGYFLATEFLAVSEVRRSIPEMHLTCKDSTPQTFACRSGDHQPEVGSHHFADICYSFCSMWAIHSRRRPRIQALESLITSNQSPKTSCPPPSM